MTNIYHCKTTDEKFISQLQLELSKAFNGCKKIVVKMHFGEVGNTKALTSKDILPITDLLQNMGFEYSLFDSSVAYPGPRGNPTTHKLLAKAKGFKNVDLGDESIDVKGKYLTYQVCTKLSDADGVLVLTHVKGHMCTGFGGAIKNLGMGALTKKSKSDIHTGGEPIFNSNCTKCGACVRMCPINGLVLKEHPIIKSCYGCSNCYYTCQHKSIELKTAPFDDLLADGANAAQSKFKKYYYVSAIKNITKNCDCMPMPGDIIAKDAGWIMGPDAVAIDEAAHDIVVKQDGEAFLKINKKKGLHQTQAAEKLGMGKRKYTLKELE